MPLPQEKCDASWNEMGWDVFSPTPGGLIGLSPSLVLCRCFVVAMS